MASVAELEMMNVAAHARFESFAQTFVRKYWETVKSGAFSMPPDEPVRETVEELLSVVSYETKFRAASVREEASYVLHMTSTHGDWWDFVFRDSNQRWELVAASAESGSRTPHDLLGPVYAQYFAPFLHHVARAANETKSV